MSTMSPAQERHDDEEPMVGMDFPQAMQAVIDGERVRRESWDNPKVYVELSAGFLRIRLADGSIKALIVSDGDLLGTDWSVVSGSHVS